ncbi:hypothetical protein OBBRIDRAFT_767616 [Obba rivulosa]|uniref:Aminoglycoside phosphotransferase domain-containing protein n=1 Tax=Obba rivulosa TaxID=1052685 RepID=A0A8E2J5Z7_9APHY|nr:hypothetical protein OBBRIDRAFT_767616 [Obba rivulosa]
MSTLLPTSAAGTYPDVHKIVRETLQKEIRTVDHIAKDGVTVTHDLTLDDGAQVVLRTSAPTMSPLVLDSEIATLKYLADQTSVPVPKVLAFASEKHELGSFSLIEKPSGVPLDTLFFDLPATEQNSLVARIAGWMLESSRHNFNAVGSVFVGEGGIQAGPMIRRSFFLDGRAKLALDRGPFTSARAYYSACAQRELDCCRALFVQDASPTYQRDLNDARLRVERIVGLMYDLISQCPGLDDDDPEMAPFTVDIHHLGLKNILVSPESPSTVTAVVDWRFTNILPFWCCARLPTWLSQSLSRNSEDRERLSAVFRAAISRVDGEDSKFLRSVDSEGTRHALDDLADYDAFKDGFLLLPALENILATIPGHEDIAGLSALLDPKTLPGRVARINLLTRGSNAMFLAMSPPRSPARALEVDGSDRVQTPTEQAVAVN